MQQQSCQSFDPQALVERLICKPTWLNILLESARTWPLPKRNIDYFCRSGMVVWRVKDLSTIQAILPLGNFNPYPGWVGLCGPSDCTCLIFAVIFLSIFGGPPRCRPASSPMGEMASRRASAAAERRPRSWPNAPRRRRRWGANWPRHSTDWRFG